MLFQVMCPSRRAPYSCAFIQRSRSFFFDPGFLVAACFFPVLWYRRKQSLEQERRVFAVDMRNHGASSHHDSMTYVDMADDIMGFLSDQVGLRPVSLSLLFVTTFGCLLHRIMAEPR